MRLTFADEWYSQDQKFFFIYMCPWVRQVVYVIRTKSPEPRLPEICVRYAPEPYIESFPYPPLPHNPNAILAPEDDLFDMQAEQMAELSDEVKRIISIV